jgi:hypothetical protein
MPYGHAYAYECNANASLTPGTLHPLAASGLNNYFN